MSDVGLEGRTDARGSDGWVLAPREPTEAMWSGLARQLVMWQRWPNPTGAKLYQHLRMIGASIPEWLPSEIQDNERSPAKGTVAACIYKAMLDACPSPRSVATGPHHNDTGKGKEDGNPGST